MEETPTVTPTSEAKIALSMAGRRVPTKALFVVALLLMLSIAGVGLFTLQSGNRLEDLAALGYPGIFLIMVIAGAGTLVPMPGHAAVIFAGAYWNPIAVGLAAGLGNATGELFGFAAGRLGRAAITEHKFARHWRFLHSLVERYGFFTILIIAMVPNFFFDFVGLLAGSLGYPWRRFWIAVAIGNSAKYIGYAYLGDVAQLWLS